MENDYKICKSELVVEDETKNHEDETKNHAGPDEVFDFECID